MPNYLLPSTTISKQQYWNNNPADHSRILVPLSECPCNYILMCGVSQLVTDHRISGMLYGYSSRPRCYLKEVFSVTISWDIILGTSQRVIQSGDSRHWRQWLLHHINKMMGVPKSRKIWFWRLFVVRIRQPVSDRIAGQENTETHINRGYTSISNHHLVLIRSSTRLFLYTQKPPNLVALCN